MVKGWIEVEFEELVDYIQPTEFIVKSTDYKDTYKTPVLTAGKSFIKGYTDEEEGIFKQLPAIIFDDFTTASRYVNFPFKVKSSAMKILVPSCDLINLKYVFYGMQITDVRSDTHKRYWISDFAKRYIPLPPINEQNRIIDKIEELFSDLDNGVAILKKAQNQLKVYRQALLKYAFEGKLTEQWRNENSPEPAEKLLERIKTEHQKRYEQELEDWKVAVKSWEKNGKQGKKPGKPKVQTINYQLSDSELEDFSTIPGQWLTTRLEAITIVITDGDHQAPPKAENGVPFITISNIKDNVIDFSNTYFVSAEYYESLPTYRKPVKGDVLFTVTGSFGIPVNIDFDSKFCFQRHIGLLRPLSLVASKWLYYLLQTRYVYNQASEMATGTAQKTVGLNSLRNFKIAVCSEEEQNEIILILESHFSIIDNLESAIDSGLKKSEALRQSTLKKAFEGRLVYQDSNDESAAELLKRIKEEKRQYLEERKQQKKTAPKRVKKMSKELSIEEVLKTSDKPMLAKDVWQQSKHKDSIEDFYKELKKIQENIKEVKKGTESLLSLIK